MRVRVGVGDVVRVRVVSKSAMMRYVDMHIYAISDMVATIIISKWGRDKLGAR